MNNTYDRILDLVVNEGSGGAKALARKGHGLDSLRAAVRGQAGGDKNIANDPDRMTRDDRGERTMEFRRDRKKRLGHADNDKLGAVEAKNRKLFPNS